MSASTRRRAALAGALVLGGVAVGTACRPRVAANGSGVLAKPEGRKIIGPAQDWDAAKTNATAVDTSVKERRKIAWDVARRALTPVPVINPTTGQQYKTPTGAGMTIPVWQTWYEMSEFTEMFADLYWYRLGPNERQTAVMTEELVDDVMAKHHRKELDPTWTMPSEDGSPNKFEKLLHQVTEPDKLRALGGVSGKGFTGFSPAMVKHYLMNWRAVIACKETEPDYTSGDPVHDMGLCFGKAFPNEAVAIKATWNKVDRPVAAFDTSAEGLKKVLTSSTASWPAMKPPTLEPGPDKIYTSPTFAEENLSFDFRLTGLHFTTKDVPHWMWITLWWSPTPNEDFGADRPKDFADIDSADGKSVWTNYKMCTTSTFDEGDEKFKAAHARFKAQGGAKPGDKSLDAAMMTAYDVTAPHQWCSNPFIEIRTGGAKTNCIGCHQHAGPGMTAFEQQNDLDAQRKSFMADFTWSFDSFSEGFRGSINQVIGDEPPDAKQ